jgi:hypothetical protein
VPLVRTDVSEELNASIIGVTRIGELGTTSIIRVTRIGELVTANVPNSPILVTLMMEALISSETSVLTRASDYCHPDSRGIRFLRNVGPYKSHTA